MRSFILGSTLVGLALAAPAPAPQDIDFDLAYELPNPTYTIASTGTEQIVTYTPQAIFESAAPQITSTADDVSQTITAVDKRQAASTTTTSTCTGATQAAGHGPVPSPDTAAAFLADPDLANAALNAPVPSGYTQTFSNLTASNSAYGYMGYTTLKSYDSAGCAAKCNAINGCMAVNIYFERDPTIDPGSSTGSCANPASTNNIKCVFWGGPVNAANANNYGQWRNQFQVVIAGSNGYVNNTIAAVPGYGTAVDLGSAAINAPYDTLGYNTFMGSAIFNAGPFNASLCAQACTLKSQYAIAHPPTDGSPVQTCQFFNTYILYINSTANLQGQYCAMYSETWSSSYATNTGQYRGSDHFMIEYSYSYSNSTNPGAPSVNAAAHQASIDISYATLQPFCSTYLGFSQAVATVTATTTVSPVVTSTFYATTSAGVTVNQKRALSTPAVLTKYPASVLSSACSLQVTAPTGTSTVTASATVTASTTTAVITQDTTVTYTVTAPPASSTD